MEKVPLKSDKELLDSIFRFNYEIDIISGEIVAVNNKSINKYLVKEFEKIHLTEYRLMKKGVKEIFPLIEESHFDNIAFLLTYLPFHYSKYIGKDNQSKVEEEKLEKRKIYDIIEIQRYVKLLNPKTNQNNLNENQLLIKFKAKNSKGNDITLTYPEFIDEINKTITSFLGRVTKKENFNLANIETIKKSRSNVKKKAQRYLEKQIKEYLENYLLADEKYDKIKNKVKIGNKKMFIAIILTKIGFIFSEEEYDE